MNIKFSKFFSTKNKAIVALGSNLGNRFNNISIATDLLRKAHKVVKSSQIYENPSLDANNNILEKENKFLNAAVQLETNFSSKDLLEYCKAIERVRN